MKSTIRASHSFSQVPQAQIQRSSFNRSHGHKTAFNSGLLVPVYVDEVLPGDTFTLRMHAIARLATPIFPIMDNIFLDSFFFFVPNRLVWGNFQKFMGEQTNPGDSISFNVPTVGAFTPTVSSLWDYMGIPPSIAIPSGYISALPSRCYSLIFNSWFRDENMVISVPVDIGDGPDVAANYTLRVRGKRHDYFTSCLPWPQKGSSVSLPLGTSAPITGLYTSSGNTVAIGTSVAMYETIAGINSVSSGFVAGSKSAAATAPGTAFNSTNTGVYADLSAATAATINQLRQSFQVQRLLERDARGGTRYTEIVRSHFGVTSPDARLQRPEYLGGGSTPVNITQIPQTSATNAQPTPKGSLSAYGIARVGGHGFTKSFTEHGTILGLVSVRADLTYQQGLNRMWRRKTRYDFYWPVLSHIGEQVVEQGEIYADFTANDQVVFGYQERYAEYRYKPSQISGILRSTAAGTLDAWHVAQKFTAAPTLNYAFIIESPAINRCLAVPSEPEFIFDSYFDLTCARPMPLYGVPGLIDHF